MEDLMLKARAYKCLEGTGQISKASQYFAFLSVTHPDMKLERRIKIAGNLADAWKTNQK